MSNASNEPLDVGPREAVNDDAPEADEIRSSADASEVEEDSGGGSDADSRGQVVDNEDQDSEPSSNAPAGEAPNDPAGT